MAGLGTMGPYTSATFGLWPPSGETLIKFGITMCKARSAFCLLCHVTCLSKHSARAAVNLLTLGLASRWPGGPHQIPTDSLLPGLEGRDFLFGKCFSSPRTFSVLRAFCHHKSEAGGIMTGRLSPNCFLLGIMGKVCGLA